MICNVCQINEGRSYTRKNKEGKLITVSQPICKQCLANKSHKFPEHITKEFLIHEHIDLNKSALTIAKENNTSESKISGQLKQFEITEIIHCKDCDTTENLITRIINNQFNKPIEVTQKICYKCHKEKQGSTLSETRKNESGEQKAKRREATKKYYENNPEQKKKETSKKLETWKNKPIEEIDVWKSKSSETKRNKSEDEKKERSYKYLKTMSEKTDEEKQERLRKMGEGVRKALLEMSEEQRKKISKKFSFTMKNRTKEEKEVTILKRQLTITLKDNWYIGNNYGKMASAFFSILHEHILQLNIPYNIIKYGNFENGEKGVYVKNVSKNFRVRFFDFYLKINNIEYNIEFDERGHYTNEKNILNDKIREQEIYQVKPNIKIYRIREDQYKKNPIKVLFDILEILQGTDNKEYWSLIKREI